MIVVLTYITLDTTTPKHIVDSPINIIIGEADNVVYYSTLDLAM
jgi:hypothetical protein